MAFDRTQLRKVGRWGPIYITDFIRREIGARETAVRKATFSLCVHLLGDLEVLNPSFCFLSHERKAVDKTLSKLLESRPCVVLTVGFQADVHLAGASADQDTLFPER